MQEPQFTGPLAHVYRSLVPLLNLFLSSEYQTKRLDPDVCDFAFGNPHELPLPGFTAALQAAIPPQNKDWFAYKNSEPAAVEAAIESTYERTGIRLAPEDLQLTTGAFSGLLIACRLVTEPGDEVIYNVPGWFFYEATIVQAGAVPVSVRTDERNFDLDLAAIEAAITPRTRAVIVNSPNNPSGRIYPPATLRALADLLTRASARIGHTIYLISDEAYGAIIVGDTPYTSPVSYYDHSLMVYTWGKVLLIPGQRIGFVALAPTMPEREALRLPLTVTIMTLGWSFPNADLQYALPQVASMSIDMDALRRRIQRMGSALAEMGYEVMMPEGTFYMNVMAPGGDDTAFAARLMEEDVICLPGTVMQMPGFFRLSLTANDAMVERALPRFERVLKAAQA